MVMVVLAYLLERRDPNEGESAVHFVAREAQRILRWSVVSLIVLTILTMVTFYFWAIIPATLAFVAYIGLLVTSAIVQRSELVAARAASASAPAGESGVESAAAARASAAADEGAPADRDVSMGLLKHETLVISIGLGAVVFLAGILAGIFFGGPMILLAMLVLFAYILLIGLPAWLAAIEDDIEEHQETEQAAATAELQAE